MDGPKCSVPGCAQAAAWSVTQQATAGRRACLCTRHWNELRVLDPDTAYDYSPISVIGDAACDG